MVETKELSPATRNEKVLSSTRRTFLTALAGAGAAISFSSKLAWANGEIGYWAKDLTNDQLTDMFNTILRIRWFERTVVDKMLTEPGYRGYNHFYVGQEAVATGVCAALNNTGGVRWRPISSTARTGRPATPSPRASTSRRWRRSMTSGPPA